MSEVGIAPVRRVLITGATGFIGTQLVERLAEEKPDWHLVATDVRESERVTSLVSRSSSLDVRDQRALARLMDEEQVDTVVHLASIVSPPPGMSRETLYEIDVEGTRNVLDAALETGVQQVVVTTSGAAYGYYADNPEWITESDSVRGNDSFAYSAHKRMVEELLTDYRSKAAHLQQLVLRPGTVLGKTVNNQITNLFDQRRIIGVAGYRSPFVFIWDQDLVGIIVQGIGCRSEGVFNVAGDGALSMQEIAMKLGKPYLALPAWLLQAALAILKPLGLNQYGPEQVKFIKYRPVLDNRRLKEVFGYVPRYSSEQAFEAYLASRQNNNEVG